jgi:hypothetical protein
VYSDVREYHAQLPIKKSDWAEQILISRKAQASIDERVDLVILDRGKHSLQQSGSQNLPAKSGREGIEPPTNGFGDRYSAN